jgi:hypothetical protein
VWYNGIVSAYEVMGREIDSHRGIGRVGSFVIEKNILKVGVWRKMWRPGLPDGIFLNQKSKFW